MNINQSFPFQSSSLYVPLSIQPVTHQESIKHMSSQSQWSPFSTPAFSPYQSSASRSYFQYSAYVSPSSRQPALSTSGITPNKRPIFKANNCCSASPSASKMQCRADSVIFNMSPTAHRKSTVNQRFYNATENYGLSSKIVKRSDQIDMSSYIRQATIQRQHGGR